VPKRFALVESRKFVWVILHTDSPSDAKTKEAATWEQMIAAWEAKLILQATEKHESQREIVLAYR